MSLALNNWALNFLSENFHFLMVTFSVYLNRGVFVMLTCREHRLGSIEYSVILNTVDSHYIEV